MKRKPVIKGKTKNTILSEQFQNLKEISGGESNIDAPHTYIHHRALFWLGTGTSIKKVP